MVNRAMNACGTSGAAFPTTELPRTAAGSAEATRWYRALRLPVESEDTARVARQVTALTLDSWGLPELVYDVQLCVSELVGNVRLHAIPDDGLRWSDASRTLTVTWRKWPGQLLVDVADFDSTAPTLPMDELFPADPAEIMSEAVLPAHGRGLNIVRSLADFVWWSSCDGGGKSIYCRFDLDGTQREQEVRIPRTDSLSSVSGLNGVGGS
jgi:anti-sigma regulatory factor (Ser/Thr protein kinase)